MAVTVTDDMTNINALDDATGDNADGSVLGSVGQVNTTIKVQGAAAGMFQSKAVGVGSAGRNLSPAQSVDGTHVFGWVHSLDPFAAAPAGFRIRIFSGTNFTTNFGEWNVGGWDNRRVVVEGFRAVAIDTARPFDAITGTPPARTSIDAIGIGGNMLAASGQNTFFVDQFKKGSKIFVRGGTNADPGKSSEIATADTTAGRGTFKSASGVFFLLAGVEIGDPTALTDSYFRDQRQTWAFEDQNVSGVLYKIAFNAGTGVNEATFGTASGTGTAKEGTGGNSFLAAGPVPFRLESLVTSIAVGLFGCSFTGPSAMLDDFARNFKVDDGGSFTDDTIDFNDADASDAPAFITPAVNDACYFGHDERFYQLKLNVGTAKVGTYTQVWEYWNGSAWAALTDVTDGTSSFTVTGTNTVTYAIPDDWAKTTISGANRFWVRNRISAFTSSTTVPAFTQGFLGMIGDVRLETAETEAIRCTFAQMGSIRVRNGAFLKKSVITNTIAPAKHAALDLGSTDPALDTVRDLVIQNCSKGILLKGTSTGTTTYNFRNIKFAGNTNDVRVDFPAAATVVINVLEGGDTPSVQNVNGSTVQINNNVTVKVTVKKEDGTALQGARVSVRKTSDNSEIVGGLTDVNGVVSGSFSFVSNTPVSVRVREGSPPTPHYFDVASPQTITSAGLDVTITMVEDTINQS